MQVLFPSRSSLPKECMALQKFTQRRTRTCSDTEAHSDRGAEETERESHTHHCTYTQIGFKAWVQILLLEQSLNLEWMIIVVALKIMDSNINKIDHLLCFSQAWCFTKPTLMVTPLQVSLKRLEPAQSSCRKLTLRNLTFPSEPCEMDYEMGNKRKTRTAMQSKIAALYRWILQSVVFLDDEEFGSTL